MRKKVKKLLSMLLVVAMVISMVPATFAANTAEVSAAEEAVGNGIYKLAFKAKSTTDKMMTTSIIVMSYDNTVIQPVKATDTTTNITPTDGGTESTMMKPGANIMKAGVKWSIKDNRSAFALTVATTENDTGTDISTGPVIGEFYFKLAAGKTTADLKKGTLRFEKDYSDGSLLKALFSQRDQAKAWMLGFKNRTILGYGDANAEDTMALTSFTYTNSTVQKLGVLTLALDQTAVDVQLADTVIKPTVTGTDTEGDPMPTAGVTYTFDPATAPIGVTYKTNGEVTVGKPAHTGTVMVTAHSDGVNSAPQTITITRADATATTVTVSGAESIVVPTGDTDATTTFTAKVVDQFGVEMNPTIDWTITPEKTGVSIANGVVKVTKDAKADITNATGTKFTVTAKVQGKEVQGTTEITVKRAAQTPTTLTVSGGANEIIVPNDAASGTPATTAAFTAAVVDQYGAAYTGTIDWTIAPVTAGITIGTNGVVSVTNAAKAAIKNATGASYTVTATLRGKDVTGNVQALTVKRAAPVNTAVKIFDGATALTADTLIIPTTDTPNTKQYSAKTYDQYGEVVEEIYTWTLTTADEKVTFVADTATVSVANGATNDSTYKLKAVGGTSTLSKEIIITVKDIEVDWTKVAAKAEITYGTAKKDAFTKLPATGTAKAGNVDLTGDFTILNPDVLLTKGDAQTITVQFKVTTVGAYNNVVITKYYTVKVNPKPIANVTVGAIAPVTYNGTAHTPATLTVTDGSLPALAVTTDYTLTYASNTNAGTAKVTLTGAGNYTGTKEVPFTIKKATITGITTAAPAHEVLANATANTSLAALQAIANNGAALPANVTINYAGGTAELPIVWANSADTHNVKGGVYTYKGTVTPGTNFEAYATTLNAKMTVTPVTGTISKVDGNAASALKTPVTVAKAKASAAANYVALKLPASIELTFSGEVPAATYNNLTFSVPLATLKAAAVDSTTKVSVTSIPAWVTIDPTKLAVDVKITAKYPVNVTVAPPTGVTYGTALGDPTPAQVADEDGTDTGTVTWKYLYEGKTAADVAYSSAEKPTQAGTYTVTATLVSTTHAGSQKSASFTIAKKALADSMIAVTGTYTYNTKPITPTYTVTDAKLLNASDYKAAITDNTNAGTAKITVTAEAKGNYSGTVAKTFTIEKAPLTALTPTITGIAKAGKVLTANLKDVADSELTWQWMRAGVNIDRATAKTYTITAADSNQAITVKAVAAAAGNYSGASKATAAVTVEKQAVSGAVSIAITNGAGAVAAKIDAKDTLTATITAMLPTEAQAGATYQWYRGTEKIDGATNAAYVVTVGDTAKVLQVVVTPITNFTGTAEASVEVGKTALTGTLTLNGTTAVGQTLTATYSNAVPVLNTDYTITWMRDGAAISDATAPTYKITAEDQGKSITAKVTAKGATYTGEILSDVKAIPASKPAAPAVTASAGYKQVTFRWTAPADNGAPVTGYVITVDGGAAINVGPDVLTHMVTGLTNGTKCVITVAAVNSVGTGAIATANATPAMPYDDSSDIDISNTTTKTEKNDDGSTTTTVTDKKAGTVTETTKFLDGSKSVVEAKNDGTIAITYTRKDGVETKTIAAPSGTVTATITVPESVGSTHVSIPVKEVKPGTVAVLIKADGTKEIIKKSTAKDGKITFPINASAKIEIIDNSKIFEDVKVNDWFASYVTFVSAHELFSGTSEKIFDPTADMNRGMLVTVLHRLENMPKGGSDNFADVQLGDYYAEAAAWAKKNNIVTGTGLGLEPYANITRESLAVMLYRYAKVGKPTGGLNQFTDGGKVSAWATDAMSWAVQTGILKGTGSKLNPLGNATRAEVAAMIQRYVELSVK